MNPAEEVRSLSGRSLASEDSDASSVVYHKSLRGVAAGVGGDGVDRDGSESSEKDVGESGEKVTDEKGGVKDIESGEKVTDENVGEKDIGENDKENTNEQQNCKRRLDVRRRTPHSPGFRRSARRRGT